MILFKQSFGPLETNALLLGCSKTKKAAVIDPAMGSEKQLLQWASDEELVIEKILLTHSHWDHFIDAASIKEKTKASLYVHAFDAQNVEHPGSDSLPTFVPVRAVHVDHFLKDQEEIQLGQLKLQVIHTPGHSPGGVCFYIKEENLLISGDTLFRGSLGNLSLPTAEAEKMWISLERLSRLPPDTRVVPGHGSETTIGKESWLKNAKEIFS